MKTVRLYGEMGKRFGTEHKLDVKTPAEAFRALCSQVRGFRQYLYDHAQHKVKIFNGPMRVLDDQDFMTPSSGEVIRVVPVIEGSGGKTNWGMVIVGIILIVVAWWNPYGWGTLAVGLMGSIGATLVSQGISAGLVQTPPAPAPDVAARESFAFGGAVNTVRQGNPVPICYGKMLIGSQVVSVGLVTGDMT